MKIAYTYYRIAHTIPVTKRITSFEDVLLLIQKSCTHRLFLGVLHIKGHFWA
jgi:hypothetical protein